MATPGGSSSRFAAFMKWVGIAAALLSFSTAVYELVHSQGELRERHRVVAEQLAAAQAEQAAGDYPAAWDSLDRAAATAAVDGLVAKLLGGLSKERKTIRAAQEDLAMEWLREAHAPEGHSFAEITDRLNGVLTDGANEASGARKGDLLAHLGWAYFLKGRSGAMTVRPEVPYREAVAVDATNPYANVFWGHWILWNHGSMSEAATHFAAALKTGRARREVRDFQLAALHNVHSDATDAAWLQVVDEMSKGREPLDADIRHELYEFYFFASHDDSVLRKMVAAVPLADQTELQNKLLQADDLDSDHKAVISTVRAKMSAGAAIPRH